MLNNDFVFFLLRTHECALRYYINIICFTISAAFIASQIFHIQVSLLTDDDNFVSKIVLSGGFLHSIRITLFSESVTAEKNSELC